LQHLVSSALHTAPGGARAYAPVVVDRDEAPWLLVEAMPVTAFGSDLFSSGRLILLLTDLRSPPRPETTQLCAAFGPRKERPLRLALPALGSASDATAALAAITSAVAAGAITTGEGADLNAIVAGFVKAVETSDLEARIETLEERAAREGK
jgi:hypothetical protein